MNKLLRQEDLEFKKQPGLYRKFPANLGYTKPGVNKQSTQDGDGGKAFSHIPVHKQSTTDDNAIGRAGRVTRVSCMVTCPPPSLTFL